MSVTIKELVKATGGDYKGVLGDKVFKDVSTDTRTIKEGDVFFAISGEHFDGNNYIDEAFSKGAMACVGTHYSNDKNIEFIKVKDCVKALGEIANYKRKKYNPKVIAITGSTGKTTTKDMVAAILSVKDKIVSTEGNLNNLIGLPLTLLRIDKTTKVCVVEMGISEAGEMQRYIEIAEPNVGLITNIGMGHMEGLKSVEAVRDEKGKLFQGVKKDGVIIVNNDDENVRIAASIVEGKKKITFGYSDSNDIVIKEVSETEDMKTNAQYKIEEDDLEVTLDTPFGCNGVNAAAAAAVALSCGAAIEDIKVGLESYESSKGRMAVFKVNSKVIIDDTYNSNPESMGEALKTFKLMKGQKVAFIGDMLELGSFAKEEHVKVGEALFKIADLVVAVGDFAEFIKEGLMNCGFDKDSIRIFKTSEDALSSVNEAAKGADIVLVKGSRGVKMEKIVEALKKGN